MADENIDETMPMRMLLLALTALTLAGCGDIDLSSIAGFAPANRAPLHSQARPQDADDAPTRCEAVAQQRAGDAATNGLSSTDQDLILKGTYADCMAWVSKHGS
jgi:hypothetical protein